MGKPIAISVFFAIIGAQTTGGMWSGFGGSKAYGSSSTDLVLATTFVSVFVVSLIVQLVKQRSVKARASSGRTSRSPHESS